MGMMPGQEKIIQDYYQKNPEAAASLRGNLYEQKIIEFIWKKKGLQKFNKVFGKNNEFGWKYYFNKI